MISNNPFATLSVFLPSIVMQVFVILMVVLVILGTLFDIIHKKNVKYFFQNAKKAKAQAKRNLSSNEKTSIIAKTFASEILTTIYDLSKIVNPNLKIDNIRLLIKEGGKSGLWKNPEGIPEFLKDLF